MRRANANGGSYVVEKVAPKPRCLVTCAIAGINSSGSLLGICTASSSAAFAPWPKLS